MGKLGEIFKLPTSLIILFVLGFGAMFVVVLPWYLKAASIALWLQLLFLLLSETDRL